MSKDQIRGYLKNKRKMRLSPWGVVKLANELGYEVKLDISVKLPAI